MRRIAALTFSGLFVLASCSSPSSVELISAASDLARDEGTAKMEMDFVSRFAGGGQSVESATRGEGVFDFAQERGRMAMSVEITPSAGVTLERCELVTDRSDLYASVPEARRQGGASWVKVDLSTIQGFDANSFSSDPMVSLDYLKSVSENVEEVGREEVRGVQTTHYRFSVSLDRLFEKLDPETRDRQKAALEQIGITTMPIDAWIDDDGLPRRIGFQLSAEQQDVQFTFEGTVEMLDYGEPVDVQVPPASEVREEAQPELAFAGCFGAPAPGAIPGQG